MVSIESFGVFRFGLPACAHPFTLSISWIGGLETVKQCPDLNVLKT
jgi:hypothetical protein